MVPETVSRATCHRSFQFCVESTGAPLLRVLRHRHLGAPFEPSLIGFDNAARVKEFRLTQTRSD